MSSTCSTRASGGRRRANYSYQVSKAALDAATERLAQALAPRIRVNGIAPGPVLPSIYQTDEGYRRLVEATPLGRAPDLTEFGRTIRYIVETARSPAR